MGQKYTQANKADIDRWVHQYGLKWAVLVSHEEYIAAKVGQWDIRLTPVKPIPMNGWQRYQEKGCWGWPLAVDSRCPS